MTDNNWVKWGEDVKRTVQSSIDSRDFSRLNEDIGRIINSAIENVNDNLKTANRTVNQTVNKTRNRAANRTVVGNGEYQNINNPTRPKLFGSTAGTTAVGILLTVAGFLGIGAFFISFIVTFLTAVLGTGIVQAGGILTAVFMGILLGCSTFMLIKGLSMTRLTRRFRRYVGILGKKTGCPVADMASRVGKSPAYICKDLKKMMNKGFFLQGHLDEENGYLIVSDDFYRQYQQAKVQYQEREKEQKIKQDKEAALPENVRQIIAEGEAFIQKIHASNDVIPGEEISAKIEHMENIVRKIFQRVQQKPELVGELKKLMSYYLPTTVKLLDAYEELDIQPILGENITRSKAEIEKTMDTLNTAFEKLLDGFYQETAWDISSDISVLETMLAQEGLTKSDFDK